MSTIAEEVEAEIRRAFPARRPEHLGPISVGDREEDRRIRRDLATVTDWTTLTPEVLAELDRQTGFAFLTKQAARFYLPAFLNADMHELLNSDLLYYLCFSHPTTSTDKQLNSQHAQLQDRWDALNEGQAAAVTHYLEWRAAAQPRGNETDVAYSLTPYWYSRS